MSSANAELSAGQGAAGAGPAGTGLAWRCLAWSVIASTFLFLLNNYLTNWLGWPGIAGVLTGAGGLAWAQVLLYGAGIAAAIAFTLRNRSRSLRADAQSIYAITAYIVRAAFWMVVFVGLADMVISFLRVEGFLESLIGHELTADLGRSNYRGTHVHLPLIGLAMVVAAFTRTLGFTWLALLVVVAELIIVFARFIFSYEQAFMGDLVRFWYAGLFLFASAYTLIEEGHVRVDVLFSTFSDRTKGMINAIGSLALGMLLCSVIIVISMNSPASIVNSPLLSFEVTQSGFGMYVKYLMASFLAVFAVTMMIQFAGYMLEGAADWRGEPGKRETAPADTH